MSLRALLAALLLLATLPAYAEVKRAPRAVDRDGARYIQGDVDGQ